MGFWSGIKHALNSTLGTENFKPLNEIIEGQKIFVASDTIIKEGTTITPKLNGTMSLVLKFNHAIVGSSVITINEYVNNTFYRTTEYVATGSGEKTTRIDFNVIKNNQYSFNINTASGAVSSLTASIGAQITDYNYFS